MSEFYSPEHRRGLRYNEPAFKVRIEPIVVTVDFPTGDRT